MPEETDIHPTLKWLYAAECDGGGISAWKDTTGKWSVAYPEVTGYLLPTMMVYGAVDLAERCVNWLLRVQNEDGSWNGLDGVPRPFDTSAIVEGLQAVGMHTDKPVKRAISWMRSLITPEGFLPNSPRCLQPEIYNLRASAIIDNVHELAYWKQNSFIYRHVRSHYIAYMLEGAVRLGDVPWAMSYLAPIYERHSWLVPFYLSDGGYGDDSDGDVCATAQLAILLSSRGIDVSHYIHAISSRIGSNGGVPQSIGDQRQIAWGAKFWLDLQELIYD